MIIAQNSKFTFQNNNKFLANYVQSRLLGQIMWDSKDGQTKWVKHWEYVHLKVVICDVWVGIELLTLDWSFISKKCSPSLLNSD
jgi:hypothetical protein